MSTLGLHSVDLLENAIKIAEKNGVRIRQEATAGGINGLCRVGHQRFLFLDPSLPAAQQLSEVMLALKQLSREASGSG